MLINELKVAIFGDQSAGKSQLINCLIDEKAFEGISEPTIGASFFKKIFFSEKLKKEIQFNIWDVAGNPRYLPLRSMYAKNTQIIIYCIDLSEKDINQDKVEKDIKQLKDYCPTATIILVGTKGEAILPANVSMLQTIDVPVGARIVTSSKSLLGRDDLLKTFMHYAHEQISLTATLPDMPAPLFFSPRTSKQVRADKYLPSLLTHDQVKSILKLVSTLEKEIKSCWPYPNKALKETKVTALLDLLNCAKTSSESKANISLATLINHIESENPTMKHGKLSTRTYTLIEGLKSSCMPEREYSKSVTV